MTQTAPLPVQPAWQQWYPVAPAPVASRRARPAGVVAGAAGALAVMVSFTTLPWFSEGTVRLAGNRTGTFDLVQDVLVRLPLATGFQVEPQPLALAYFSWLGWALLLVAGLLTVLANIPATAARGVRVAGAIVAAGAAALTVGAIDLLDVHGGSFRAKAPSFGDYLSEAGPGFYTALAGFALLALAAVLGARRRV